MGSGTFYPSVTGDDGVRRNDGWFWTNNSILYMGDYAQPHDVFIRFPNVTIDSGVIIESAFIRFTARYSDSSANCKVTIAFNDADDAVAPTSGAEFLALSLTSTVAWGPIASWTAGNQYDSDDISVPLQTVINRGGWASGQALMVVIEDNGSSSVHTRQVSPVEYDSGSEKAELHITYREPILVDTEESVSVSDTIFAVNMMGYISDGVGLGDASDEMMGMPEETFDVDDDIRGGVVYRADNTEGTDLGDEIGGGFTYEKSNTEGVALGDSATAGLEYAASTTEAVALGDTSDGGKSSTLTETSQIFEALGWGWIKSLTSTAEIADTVTVNMAVPVTDVLTAGDAVVTKWVGTETATSTLEMFGNALVAQVFNESVTSTSDAVDAVTFLHTMISVAESTFGAADATSSKATFNPLVAESVAAAATISLLLTINKTIAESAAATETVIPGWLETVSDSAAIVDTAAIRWVAMHILTDSLEATDAATGLFNFTDTIADTFEAAAAVVIKQALQDSITEILNFNMTLMLDDELWECWVLNTNEFAPSVYSGFDFNSYAVYNDQAFGCREDGIYRLDGTTDNNSAFNAGIVLPETSFGTARKKRFRKAYFGLSGSSPSIRMETSSGNVTYNITSSKANIGRNQYGKEWTVKVQGFDDMDFIELVPIILTR